MSGLGRFCNSSIALAVIACALPLPAQGTTWTDPATGKVVAVGSGNKAGLEEINFETDSSIVVDGFPTLGCVAEAMREDSSLFIVISGYADGRGSLLHNRRLSQARAEAVMRYLRMAGVPEDRMMAIGYGPLPKGTKEVNFVNRRVVVTPHAGAFSGPVVDKIVVKEPCAGVATGHKAVGRIESNGTTFLISVDYDRIREDFRSEMLQMLREQDRRDRKDGADEGNERDEGADQPSGFQVGGGTRRQDADSSGTHSKRALVAEESPAREDNWERDAWRRSDEPMDLSSFAGRVTILGGHSSIKGDDSWWGGDAGFAWAYGSASLQGGLGFDGSPLRRKVDGEAAFTWHFMSGLNISAIGTYARLSGAASDAVPSQTGSSSMVGSRVGWERTSWSLGATYLRATGKAALDPSVSALESGSVAALDLSLTGEAWSTVFQAFRFGKPSGVAGDLSRTLGGRLEFSHHFAALSVLAGVEALPTYAAFSDKAETRIFLGLRFGGWQARSGRGWLVIPSARERVAF